MTKPTINPGIHGGLSLSGDINETQAYYDGWAQKYNADVADGGYVAPQVMVDCLQRTPTQQQLAFAPDDKNIKIFDVGCGTGLVGKALAEVGYKHIHGCDLSAAMVEQARLNGSYEELHGEINILEPLPDSWRHAYDVVMSCGMFTCGHVPPDAALQLFAMAKSGGVVIISTRVSYADDSDYLASHQRFIESGAVVSLLDFRDAPYTSDGNAHYWSYRVL